MNFVIAVIIFSLILLFLAASVIHYLVFFFSLFKKIYLVGNSNDTVL